MNLLSKTLTLGLVTLLLPACLQESTGGTPEHADDTAIDTTAGPDGTQDTATAPSDTQRADTSLPGDVPTENNTGTGGMSPTLLVEERVALDNYKRPVRPSLAVDADGTPHFYVTVWRDQEDIAGYLVREDDAWRHVGVVRAGSAGIGHGGGIAYGFVDWTTASGLQVWIWRDTDGTIGTDNRTDIFRYQQDSWTVVDSVADTEAYQVLRDSSGAAVAAMGHYGGNTYVLAPTVEGWERTFLPAYSVNRPLATFTPAGTVAAVSRLQLVHLGGPTEAIDPDGDNELMPLGPVLDDDGAIHVLRQTSSHYGAELVQSTRDSPGHWSHVVLASDTAYPTAEACPTTHGEPCVFFGERVRATALTSTGEVVVPVLVRQPQRIEYWRQCLRYDPNFMGSTQGPCIEPDGPSGPWLAHPTVVPDGDTVLEVAGVVVPLAEPFPPSNTRPVATVDTAGHLHLAYLDREGLRYLLIDLYGE
ncbi:MAG: hypothetical protein ACI9MR_003675 [Myxococcota bacterium]|jgi:hypothetical protein